jgi:hypothetical protein
LNIPALDHLIRAYFHEDWPSMGTSQDVVDQFVKDEPDLAAALPTEITLLLTSMPDESEVEALLDRLGCAYAADRYAGGYRRWLSTIAARAREQV